MSATEVCFYEVILCGFNSIIVADSGLLECDTASLSKRFQTFRRKVSFSPLGFMDLERLQMNETRSCETSGTTYPERSVTSQKIVILDYNAVRTWRLA